jgi:hypothetical protein
MAVLGSDIMIDMHVTADTDVDSIRGAVLENSRLHPALAGDLRKAIEKTTTDVLHNHGITDCSLTVDLEFRDERVPGAPRERIDARLDVEREESLLASVDGAVDAPERARIADATEAFLKEHLADEGLNDVVETTVIVTPVQFR